MTENRKALVLGATGGVGGAIAEALLRHGWQVRGLARDVAAAKRRDADIEWIGGDAMNAADVTGAAAGVAVIVHAVNPPNYANWETLVLPMIDNTIAAARATGGARVVLPGTIYNFDVRNTPVIDAETPQNPRSRKGAVRKALEARLEAAAPGVPSLILRAGDFFGPGVRSSWFSQAMVTPRKPLSRLVNPARGAGHSWAYLPDLAETFAQLIDRHEQLRPFQRVQFEGLYDDTGRVLIEALNRAAGRQLPVWPFPWWAMRMLAPIGGFPREAAEIADCWRYPMRMDNRRLVEIVGREPRTPLDQAIRTTLMDMGCVPAEARTSAVAA